MLPPSCKRDSPEVFSNQRSSGVWRGHVQPVCSPVAGQRHAAFFDGHDGLSVHAIAPRHNGCLAATQLKQGLRGILSAIRAQQRQRAAKIVCGFGRLLSDLRRGGVLCHESDPVVSPIRLMCRISGEAQGALLACAEGCRGLLGGLHLEAFFQHVRRLHRIFTRETGVAILR